MALSQETEHAIGLCYDAAIAPELWTDALDHLAWSLGAEASMLFAHDPDETPLCLARSTQSYAMDEYWLRNKDWVTDVYAERAVPLARAGYISIIESQIFSEDELRVSAFHREVARPSGFEHWACTCFTTEARTRCLPFFRGSTAFTCEDGRQLAEVSPHMSRAVGLAEKFACSGAAGGITALEKLGCAAMLVDGRGSIMRLNCPADALLGADFCIRNGRPWAADGQSLARLNRLIATIQCAGRAVAPCLEPVIISHEGFPWLLVEAMSVTPLGSDVFGGGRAILVISDLTKPQTSNATLLRLIFGLTAAEARLTVAICEGNDLDEAAVSFGVSRETVRSQLRAVFAKTGCRRQVELVALAARIKIPAPN